MTTISLVIPSWHYWFDPIKLQPLWELYYATLLAEKFPQVDVDIIDMRTEEGEPPREDLPGRDVYVYWIMKAADAFEIYDLAARLRKAYPKSIHIAGGTHADHLPQQCAENFDVVLNGTAEQTMVQTIGDILAGRPLEQFVKAPPQQHFSIFPQARRDFIPHERVVNDKHFQKYGSVPGTGVYFSRGCGFKCNFCVYNNPPRFEYRTPEQITAEIEYLKKEYGVQGINLRDEVCIPVSPKEARRYLEAIGNGGVIWRGQTVPFGDEEMVRLAAESGLQEVALGLESVDSDLVLEIANKPSKSIENNRRYIEILKKYGIKVKVCLIFGLPGESEKVVSNTITFLEDVQPDFVAVSGFDPVPGSTFHREPERYGIRHIDEDLSKHAHLLFRFGDHEDVGLPFEYESVTPWGKGFSRDQIAANIQEIQTYLREHKMSY
jgi:radical SAM superfamily enzyme YgiQ (UPF0313 family)